MKQLVIHTETEQEYNQLMDIMESNGWTWESGDKPKEEDNYGVYTSLTCIEYKNKFEYCYIEYFQKITDEYEIVKFKDWIKTQNHTQTMKLPEYFCIKRDAENPLWDKYISWLNNKNPEGNYDGKPNGYYGKGKNEDRFRHKEEFDFEGARLITLDQWNEAVNVNPTKQSKTIKQTLTYEIIKVRSDGVKFEKDTIDGETIESIQKRIGEYRSQANKLQGLLTAHKNIKF